MTFSPSNTLGPFLPTSTFFPEDFEQFRIKFLELYRNIANTTNTREVGIFDEVEFLTGEQWFEPGNSQQKRRTFRRAYSISSSGAFDHGLSGITLYTRIYGSATNGTIFFPIPYVSIVLAEQIQIQVNSTQVVITSGGSAPAITNGIVVLEFLKN